MKFFAILCLLISGTFFGLPLLTSAMLQPTVFTVNAGGSIQAAIDQAAYGDTIIVQAGASFAPIVLRAKSGSGTITIKTSGTLVPGAQIGPLNESQVAKIVTPNEYPAIEAEADAHDYKLSGIVATNIGGAVFTPEIVLLGSRSSGGGIPFDHRPHHIWLDQCWIREATNDTTTPDSPNTTADRGLNNSADSISLTNSRVGGFRAYKSATEHAESSNAILLAGATNFVDINTRHESWFCPLFLQPIADSPNKATLSNATYDDATHTWSADFSQVTNLLVGDLVSLRTTCGRDLTDGVTEPCGHMPVTNNSHSNEAVANEAGRISTISGKHVTGQSWGTFDGNLAGGNPLNQVPDTPGLAQWRGFTNENITIVRAQFVIAFNAAEKVWTDSHGSPTTLPRSTQTSTGNGPKSAIEIKSGRNVSIDGATQDGWYTSFVLLTSRNQGNRMTSGGAPWAGLFDIRITNTYQQPMRNSDRLSSQVIGGPQLEDNEYSNVRSGPILLANNLFSGTEMLLSSMGAADNVTVVHNTDPGSASTANSAIKGQGSPSLGFTLKDNIFKHNEYGLNCQIVNVNCWPGIVQKGNVIIDNRSVSSKAGDGPLNGRYPNDFIAANEAAVGWDANRRLLPTSPYKGKASDGKDPGVDVDQLLAALGGTLPATPTPTPTPSPTSTPTPTPTPVAIPTPTPLPTPLTHDWPWPRTIVEQRILYEQRRQEGWRNCHVVGEYTMSPYLSCERP